MEKGRISYVFYEQAVDSLMYLMMCTKSHVFNDVH